MHAICDVARFYLTGIWAGSAETAQQLAHFLHAASRDQVQHWASLTATLCCKALMRPDPGQAAVRLEVALLALQAAHLRGMTFDPKHRPACGGSATDIRKGAAMQDNLAALIQNISLGDGTLKDLDFDEETRAWWTSVAVRDPDGVETAFELEFQYLELPEEDGSPPYLVVCWVVIPPPKMRREAYQDLELLQRINHLNSEPGCKFRLQDDGRGNVSLVCETDLPADLVTQAWLQRAFERSRDVAAAYFDHLQDAAC